MSTRIGVAAFLGACALASAQPPQTGTIVVWGEGSGMPTAPSGDFVGVAAGPWHGLAMRRDGSLVPFGSFHSAQVPPGPFVTMEPAGTDFSEFNIGIRPNGSAESWGDVLPGSSTIPPGQYKQATWWAWGGFLLRQDGELVGLGIPWHLATLPPGPFVSVDVGPSWVVTLRPDGTLFAWGVDVGGVLTNLPSGQFKAVVAGLANGLAIRIDGTLKAWGSDPTGVGQLNVPPGTFTSVDIGEHDFGQDWSIALRTDGSLVVWGDVPPTLAAVPHGKFAAIATGQLFAVALAGCYADCNDDGQTTVADFGCFQTRFISASQYADCTGRGCSPSPTSGASRRSS